MLASTKRFDTGEALLRGVLDGVVDFATACENQGDKLSMQNSLWQLYTEKRPAYTNKAQSCLDLVSHSNPNTIEMILVM